MTTLTDFAPLAGSVGGGFFVGMLVRYAIKKVIRIAAVIVGLFIAALAYLEYQKIINVDWIRVQSVSQKRYYMDCRLSNAYFKQYWSFPHCKILGPSNIIPLTSSVSAGFVLGVLRGQNEYLTTNRNGKFQMKGDVRKQRKEHSKGYSVYES